MVRKILLGCMALFGLFFVVTYVGLRSLYRPGTPPEIQDFRPTSFVPRTGTPLYFSDGSKLYHDREGSARAPRVAHLDR